METEWNRRDQRVESEERRMNEEVQDFARKRLQYVSRYEIVEQIGSGSFGHIFKVREIRGQDAQGKDGEIYVLKQVKLEGLTKEEEEDTTREAHLMLSIEDHENIVKHHESFIEGGYLNMVMEYCSGGDLGKLIRETRESGEYFSESFIWKVFVQVCLALDHLHQNRVLHRDIKPENIFLDGDSRVKVGDLGLGRLLSTQSRHARTTVGTPLYFSPELCREDAYDERSDVWAFGCLIYHMVTLRPPFMAKNPISLAQKIVNAKLKPLPSEYSSDLHFVVHRMLEKDPRNRPNISQLLNYGPTKIHLMEDRMSVREQTLIDRFERREGNLRQHIAELEKKLSACEEEMRQMRASHEAIVESVQRSHHNALRQVQTLEDKFRKVELSSVCETCAGTKHIVQQKKHRTTSQTTRTPKYSKGGQSFNETEKMCTPVSTTPHHTAKKGVKCQSITPTAKRSDQKDCHSHPDQVRAKHMGTHKVVSAKERQQQSGLCAEKKGSLATTAAKERQRGRDAPRKVRNAPSPPPPPPPLPEKYQQPGEEEDHHAEKENHPFLFGRNIFPTTGPSPLKMPGPARRVPSSFILSEDDFVG